VAQTIGMAKVAEMASRLGAIDNMQQTLAMSLGAGETTVLRLAGAYAEIVNGGKKVEPTLIDRVQDSNGWTIYRHDQRPCDGCQMSNYNGEAPPEIPDMRQQVLDPATAYQMVSMLEGVVQRGTGTAVKAVGKPLAGKTGTTNEGRDVWFMGFSPDLVAGVYLGFDQPRSLGEKATGGRYSAPIFRDFMMEALKDKPATPFRVPPGIRLVRVDYYSGERAMPGAGKVILGGLQARHRADRPGERHPGRRELWPGCRLWLDHSHRPGGRGWPGRHDDHRFHRRLPARSAAPERRAGQPAGHHRRADRPAPEHPAARHHAVRRGGAAAPAGRAAGPPGSGGG